MSVQSSPHCRRLKSSVHESRVDVSAHRILLESLLIVLAPALAAVVCKCGYKFYIHVVLQHNYRKKMMYWLWLALEGHYFLAIFGSTFLAVMVFALGGTGMGASSAAGGCNASSSSTSSSRRFAKLLEVGVLAMAALGGASTA